MKLIKDFRWTIALAALGLFVLVNLLLTNRPIGFYSMMQVEEIDTLPDSAPLAEIRRGALYGSGFIEHLRPAVSPLDRRTQPLRLGWVYKEAGFFGLPFYAENVSYGPTLYVDTGIGYVITGVSRSDISLIEREVGRPIITDYSFAWYRHVWGVLFLPLLFLLIWLWRKERHAREERQWRAAETEAPLEA
jgi:hypothetical protein